MRSRTGGREGKLMIHRNKSNSECLTCSLRNSSLSRRIKDSTQDAKTARNLNLRKYITIQELLAAIQAVPLSAWKGIFSWLQIPYISLPICLVISIINLQNISRCNYLYCASHSISHI